MTKAKGLTEKSVKVLSLIADGFSYGQIVDGHPGITYRDIFDAAKEALCLNGASWDYEEHMAAIRKNHPRAYEPWTEDEEARLSGLRDQEVSLDEIAVRLQRQPSAVRSRLEKLATKAKQEP